jgi:3-phosphoshikimate 1-carboxyvinyltransferase
MSRELEIIPPGHALDAVVSVPGSKSITNRALMCAALAQGTSLLSGAQFSDDSRHMAASLRALGAGVVEDAAAGTMLVEGLGGPPRIPPGALPKVYVGNAGTAARFLPCLAAAGSGEVLFDSDERMRERPMGELLRVLETQGARVRAAGDAPDTGMVQGYPFVLQAAGLKGGAVELDLTDSTQFASGLLMAAPYGAEDLRLRVLGGRLQTPYVSMSAAVMEHFGVKVKSEPGRWTVARGQAYRAQERYAVEPDLSGAAYCFAAPALAGGRVKVRGAGNASIQGDIAFLKVLQHMGVRFYQDPDGLTAEHFPDEALKGGLRVDMNAFSDQALTLAALAPFAAGPVSIVNVAHIRRQECDRLKAISVNLRALGVGVREFEDGVEIQPWPAAERRGGRIRTFGDHRVAMAFSLIGLRVPGIVIDDADCVAKTFAAFWDVMERLRAGGHGA